MWWYKNNPTTTRAETFAHSWPVTKYQHIWAQLTIKEYSQLRHGTIFLSLRSSFWISNFAIKHLPLTDWKDWHSVISSGIMGWCSFIVTEFISKFCSIFLQQCFKYDRGVIEFLWCWACSSIILNGWFEFKALILVHLRPLISWSLRSMGNTTVIASHPILGPFNAH